MPAACSHVHIVHFEFNDKIFLVVASTTSTASAMTATTTVVAHPTGFEVDEAIGFFDDDENSPPPFSVSLKQQRSYQKSLQDYYKARKSQKTFESNLREKKQANKTFRYTGKDCARRVYDRSLYNKVVIASSVTEISPNSFKNWKNLSQVISEYPSHCQEIGDNAFYGCLALKSMENEDSLPATIHTIGANAFAYSGLQYISLPLNLTTIRQHGKNDGNTEGIDIECSILHSQHSFPLPPHYSLPRMHQLDIRRNSKFGHNHCPWRLSRLHQSANCPTAMVSVCSCIDSLGKIVHILTF